MTFLVEESRHRRADVNPIWLGSESLYSGVPLSDRCTRVPVFGKTTDARVHRVVLGECSFSMFSHVLVSRHSKDLDGKRAAFCLKLCEDLGCGWSATTPR